MIDRAAKLEIMGTVRRAMQELLEDANEVWLAPDEFLNQFQMFNADWLTRNGELLPRERVTYIGKDGQHQTRWAYARNKTQRLIREHQILMPKSNKNG